MVLFSKFVKTITNINRWVAFWILLLLMPVITIFSIFRTLDHPVVGDVELVQFSMALLIVGSLAFTEANNAHISIGIIVDRFPQILQTIIDIVTYACTLIFCLIVCYVYTFKMNILESSSLLSLSFWPFKVLLIFGFFAWGLEALLKLVQSIQGLLKTIRDPRHSKVSTEKDRSFADNTNYKSVIDKENSLS